ncbi:copper resistance CopC/CopD family protein [Solirubrobacter soli]|uniref:copper resistance CopC/CopD family protein n=1 Tax=Solirubrobacter soli TaxID=363832 RepID=UPI000400A440|nr:copper resistance protein CopC [Solirubrobacter soli]
MIARIVLLALLLGALMPASAQAHATIVRTSPADQQVLKTQPRVVSLEWSEAVDLGEHSVRLLDSAGEEVKTAPAKHGPGGAATAVLELPPGLADGTYVVAWRVVSSDSHPVSGAFSFSIGTPSQVVFDTGSSSSAAVRTLDAIGRGIAFAGLALALGAAFVLFALDGPARARRLLWGGVGALVFGSLVVLLMQGPYASGGSVLDAFDPSSLSFSLGTRFGQAVLARIVLTVAFAVLLARGLRVPAALCGIALIFTWTLVDHSRTGVQTWLGVPAASLHLLAMALWFGGLIVVLVCGEDAPLARFSRVALVCFVVLGVTGVYLAYRQSGELGALPNTVFGRLLLFKTAAVLGIIALAYFSRRAVQRRSTPRRTVAGEAFLGVAVLALTAVLVNTAPARVAYVDPIHTTVAGPGSGTVEVRVDPAKQGENVTDIYLVSRGGKLTEVPELTARLRPKDGSSGPLDVPLRQAERGHFVASPMVVPYPGDWILRLQIRTSEIDESDIDVPLKIR